MWTRLNALIVKELLAVLRDPSAAPILIVPPIMQLFVFSYAATLEVKNVDDCDPQPRQRPLGPGTDRSASRARRPSGDRIAGSSERRSREAIDNQHGHCGRCRSARTSPASRRRERRPTLQVILDGRRSTPRRSSPAMLTQIVAASPPNTPAGTTRRPAPTIVSTSRLVQPEPRPTMVHGAEPDRRHARADRAHRHRPVDRARARSSAPSTS